MFGEFWPSIPKHRYTEQMVNSCVLILRPHRLLWDRPWEIFTTESLRIGTLVRPWPGYSRILCKSSSMVLTVVRDSLMKELTPADKYILCRHW